MDYFLELFDNIKSAIFINSNDTEVMRAKKIIWYAFFGAIIMIFIISWIIFVSFTFSTHNVKVPNLESENIYAALRKLSDKKLVANVYPKYSEIYEEGVIYDQKPIQGTVVKKGRNITFSVSLGQQQASLPDFRGFSLFELAEYLDKKYIDSKIPFKINTPVYEFTEDIEKGRIIKQQPEDGTPIYNIKKISIWVSNGPKEEGKKLLDNYINKKLDEVLIEIGKSEISYNINFNVTNKQSDDFLVTDQSLGKGMVVDEIIKENKILILSVEKYLMKEENAVTGNFLYDLPLKSLPYQLVIKVKDTEATEKILLQTETKGGVPLSLPYSAKKFSKIMAYIDGKLTFEYEILEKIEEEN